MTVLLTLGQAVESHARLRPTEIAIRDLTESLTWAGLDERANRLANALLGMGLVKGDRVGVLAYNRIEWVEIYLGAAKAGLVAVPVNFRLTADDVAYIADDCQVSAFIVEASLRDRVESARTQLAIPDDRWLLLDGEAPGWHRYDHALGSASEQAPPVVVAPDDLWCLMYTSGTTGRPKGAMRSHRSMAMIASATAIEFSLRRNDTALLVMPLCHANSLNFMTAFVALGAAVTIFSMASFDPRRCLEELSNATFSSLVPTHYSMMLEVPLAQRPDTGSIAKLLVSSATAFVETKRRIIEMFPNAGLYELYGSTEAGWVTMLHPADQFDHLGSVGREVVGSAPIRLLDDDGQEVPDGDPGELFSSSPQNFEGYWNLPDKTSEAFRGAYLTVGDIARRNADGYIELIDRKKNLIVSGGENIYPSEVENVLADHASVLDVAVVGVPDEKWSERVVAAVVLRDGATADESELADWCASRLAGFKRPREIAFLNSSDMPRNATGKILHRELRERLS